MAAFGFTPASEQDIFRIETSGQPNAITGSVLSGEEARHFYENLMKDNQLEVARSEGGKTDHGRQHQSKHRKTESSRRARRRRSRAMASEVQQGQTSSAEDRRAGGSEGTQRSQTNDSERFEELQGLRLLHCANEGNLSGLKELLSKGVDINFQV